MTSYNRIVQWPIFACLVFILIFSNLEIRSLYKLPFPHFQELVLDENGLEDVATILCGFRVVAADIAWVQLLQYTSTPTLLNEDPHHSLPQLKEETLRVVRIDPQFHRAYFFGAGILAYLRNVDRPGEALDILREGARNNPGDWLFRVYIAAIACQRKQKFGKVAALLEEAVRQPDCPGVIKAILANTYKRLGQYGKAIEVWNFVLEDPTASDYHPRARAQIRELEKLFQTSQEVSPKR